MRIKLIIPYHKNQLLATDTLGPVSKIHTTICKNQRVKPALKKQQKYLKLKHSLCTVYVLNTARFDLPPAISGIVS